MYEAPEWHKQLLPHFAEGWGAYVSCGSGWKDIILNATNEFDKMGIKWEIYQIKEKFGLLRMYCGIVGVSSEWIEKISTPEYVLTKDDKKLLKYALNTNDQTKIKSIQDKFDQIVAEAETKSDTTCEGCGQPGKRRSGNWIQTLCTKCHNKTKEKK